MNQKDRVAERSLSARDRGISAAIIALLLSGCVPNVALRLKADCARRPAAKAVHCYLAGRQPHMAGEAPTCYLDAIDQSDLEAARRYFSQRCVKWRETLRRQSRETT